MFGGGPDLGAAKAEKAQSAMRRYFDCILLLPRYTTGLPASLMPIVADLLVRRRQRAQVCSDRLNPLLVRWIAHPRVLHPSIPTSASTLFIFRQEPYA